MTYHWLDNLEPAAYFRWFGEIAAIPHGSRKEQQLTAWLQKFAADRGIPCELDRAGNLLMELRAHAGYEDQPAILFQAHMDMIWKADEGVDFDFATQPLDLYVEGDCIRARGTTLGADNAVGLATMLALADDPTIPRPALQLLFTVAEEVGMVGIRAVDPATITARRMINMDCGDSHVLCVSSAGTNDLGIDHTFPTEAPCGQGLRITLSGGKGGHPSICANAGRFCAAGAFGDLLSALPAFRLCSLTGSEAIMGWGEAVILAPEGSEASLQRQFDAIASIYAQTDEGIRMALTPCQPCRGRLPQDRPGAAASAQRPVPLRRQPPGYHRHLRRRYRHEPGKRQLQPAFPSALHGHCRQQPAICPFPLHHRPPGVGAEEP